MRIQQEKFFSKAFSFFLFLLLVYGVSFLGSWVTEHSLDPWYRNLKKGGWTPPPWVFGLVWTVLYGMIGWAGALFYQAQKTKERKTVLILYGVQLFLNGIWSFLFFYFRQPFLALTDLFFLTVFVGWTIWIGRRVSKAGSNLLIPYFLWTLYALSLNGAIVYYNPS